MPFDPDTKTTALLWCDRHCCLCKKACGINIQVHHLVPEGKGGSDDLENAIPLCFECHSEVMRYNDEHPIGTKYKIEELRARRDQVYEEFTRYLVPPLEYYVTQQLHKDEQRQFPDVGFVISHVGDLLPVQVRVMIDVVLGDRFEALQSEHYSGKKLWNLNPRHRFHGHFTFPEEFVSRGDQIALRVTMHVIDQYRREHQLLPEGYVYMRDVNDWYAEPSF